MRKRALSRGRISWRWELSLGLLVLPREHLCSPAFGSASMRHFSPIARPEDWGLKGSPGNWQNKEEEQIFFLQVIHGSSFPVRAVGGESILRPQVYPCACCSTWLGQTNPSFSPLRAHLWACNLLTIKKGSSHKEWMFSSLPVAIKGRILCLLVLESLPLLPHELLIAAPEEVSNPPGSEWYILAFDLASSNRPSS